MLFIIYVYNYLSFCILNDQNKSVKTVNDQLNSEVESLRKEIERLMDALNTAACTRCGGSTVGDLTMVYRVELAKLRATVAQQSTEIAQLSAEVKKTQNSHVYYNLISRGYKIITIFTC